MSAPPWCSKKRQDLKNDIEKAVTKEMSVLRVGFNFLPDDQLRGKALLNLRIPSSFGGKINWKRIGPNFSLGIEETPAPQYVVPSYEGPRKFFKTRLPRRPEEQRPDVGLRLITFRDPAAPVAGRKNPVSQATGKTRDTTSKVKSSKTATREEPPEAARATPAAVSARRRSSKRVLFREESDKGPSMTPADTPSPAEQSRIKDGAKVGTKADAGKGADPLTEAFEPPSSPEDLHQARSRPITLGILGTKQTHSKATRNALAARAAEMTRKLLQRRRPKSPPQGVSVGVSRAPEEAARAEPREVADGDPGGRRGKRPVQEDNPHVDAPAAAEDRTSVPDEKSSGRDETRLADLPAGPDRGPRPPPPGQTEDIPPVESEGALHTEQQTTHRDSANGEDVRSSPAPAPAAGQLRDAVDFTMTFCKTAGERPSSAAPVERPVKRKSLSLAKKKRLSGAAPDAADESVPTAAKRRAVQVQATPRSPRSPAPVLSQKRTTRVSWAKPSPTLPPSPDICSANTILRSASPALPSPARTLPTPPGAQLQASSPILCPSSRKRPRFRERRSQDAEVSQTRDVAIPPQNVPHTVGLPAAGRPADSDSSDTIRPSQYVHVPSRQAPADSDSSDQIRPTQTQNLCIPATQPAEDQADSDSSDQIQPSQYVHVPSRQAPADSNSSDQIRAEDQADSDSSDQIQPSQYVHVPSRQAPADSDSSDQIRPTQTQNLCIPATQPAEDQADSDSSDQIQQTQRVIISETPHTGDPDDSDSSDVIQPTQRVIISETPHTGDPDDSDSSDVIQPSQYFSTVPASRAEQCRRPDDGSDERDAVKPSQRRLDKLSRSSSPAGRRPAVPSEGRRRREGSSYEPSQLSDEQRRERERLARQLFASATNDLETADTESPGQDGRGENDATSARTHPSEELADTSVSGPSRMTVGHVTPGTLEDAAQHVSLRDAAERALLARGSAAAASRDAPRSRSSSKAASRTPSTRRGSALSSPRRRAEEARQVVGSDSDSEETLRARERARRSRRSRELIRRNSQGEAVEHRGEAAVAARTVVSVVSVSLGQARESQKVPVPPPPVAYTSSDGDTSYDRRSRSICSIPCRPGPYRPPTLVPPTPQRYYDSTTSDEVPLPRRPKVLMSPPLVRRPTFSTTTTTTEGSTILDIITESTQPSSEAVSSDPGLEGANSVFSFPPARSPQHFARTGTAPRAPGPRWSISAQGILLENRGEQEPERAPCPPGPRSSKSVQSILLVKRREQEPERTPCPPGPRSSRSAQSILLEKRSEQERRATVAASVPGRRQSGEKSTKSASKCAVSIERILAPRGPLEENSKHESDSDLDLGSDVDLDFEDSEYDTDEKTVSPTPAPGRFVPTTPGRAPARTRYRPERNDSVLRNLFETPRRPLEQAMNPKKIHMSSVGRRASPPPPPQDPRDESLPSTVPVSASTQRSHREGTSQSQSPSRSSSRRNDVSQPFLEPRTTSRGRAAARAAAAATGRERTKENVSPP